MHLPEQDRVDIRRDRILGERLFGIEFGRLDALVNPGSDVINERNDEEQSRTPDAAQPAESQYDGPLPLLGHQ